MNLDTEGLFIIKPTYKVVRASFKLVQNHNSLIGGCCHRILFGRSTPCPGCPVDQVTATGHPQTRRLPDSRLAHVIPLSGVDSELAVDCLGRDDRIDHSRELSVLNRFMSEILDAIPHKTLVVDREKQILKHNRSVAGGMDRGNGELIGADLKRAGALYSDDALLHKVDSCFRRGGYTRLRRCAPSSAGGPSVEHYIAKLDQRAGVDAVLILSEALPTSSDQLKMMRAERIRGLGDFACRVIHDINNPLTTILNRLDLLRIEKIGERFTDELDVISQQVKRITAILDDLSLLRCSSNEEGILVKISEMVEKVLMIVELQRPELRKTSVRVESPHPVPPLFCQESNLVIAVREVLINAMEAAGEKGEVVISIGRDADNFYLKVRDNGPGIPSDQVDKIFDIFYSTKNGQRRAGLGLTIACAVVMQHQGDIEVDSTPGHGTEVVITLPDRNHDETTE